MKCDVCRRNERLGTKPLCEVCCEAITRVAWAQLRIETTIAFEALKAAKRPRRIDVDEYRKAYPGLKPPQLA
jgi:hypothetical protein